MPESDLSNFAFRGLTLEEKINKCHMMAQEAEGFAAVSHENRDQYLDLAAKWYELAQEMLQAQDTLRTAKD